MVGFDEFADDVKPQPQIEEFDDDNKDGNDFFDDVHSHLEIDDNNESVRALTLKDGINYDDNKFDQHRAQYAVGYSAVDDLNDDGMID